MHISKRLSHSEKMIESCIEAEVKAGEKKSKPATAKKGTVHALYLRR